MSRSVAMRASLVAIGANALLLAVKATATGLSDSLTIFSETLNSLADVVSAVVIVLCVRWAWQKADDSHLCLPFIPYSLPRKGLRIDESSASDTFTPVITRPIGV